MFPTTIERFDVLGLHPLSSSHQEAFDGFDLALHLSTGESYVYGVRTEKLVLGGAPNDPSGWLAGYVPVRVEFDPPAVRFWDFNEPMWIGPEPRPCLAWSNAEFFTRAGIDYVLRVGNLAKTLRGRDGDGLPPMADVPRLRAEPHRRPL
jgi:hypothetical protein